MTSSNPITLVGQTIDGLESVAALLINEPVTPQPLTAEAIHSIERLVPQLRSVMTMLLQAGGMQGMLNLSPPRDEQSASSERLHRFRNALSDPRGVAP